MSYSKADKAILTKATDLGFDTNQMKALKESINVHIPYAILESYVAQKTPTQVMINFTNTFGWAFNNPYHSNAIVPTPEQAAICCKAKNAQIGQAVMDGIKDKLSNEKLEFIANIDVGVSNRFIQDLRVMFNYFSVEDLMPLIVLKRLEANSN